MIIKNRQQMVHARIWDEFQMQKAIVIKLALEMSEDTLFLDSDIVFFKPINCIDKTKDIGVSPHYIKKSNTDEVGFYNGGLPNGPKIKMFQLIGLNLLKHHDIMIKHHWKI